MTKKLSIIAVVLLLALATQVFALSVPASVDFGTATNPVDRSNPEADRVADQVRTASTTFTITNDQNVSIDITGISFAEVQYTGFSMNFTNTTGNAALSFPISLENGTSVTIRATSVVPASISTNSAGESDGRGYRVQAESVGSITVQSSNGTRSIATRMFVKPVLDVSLDIRIDGSTYYPDDRDVREIPPDSAISVCLDIRNLFRWEDNNRDLNVEIRSSSSNRDFRFDSARITERIRNDDEIDICFNVEPDYARMRFPSSTSIELNIDTTDDNGANHKIVFSFPIEVRLPAWEVNLFGQRLSPSSVCAGDSVIVEFTVENVGSNNQRNIQTKVSQTNFNFERVEGPFQLERVDRDRRDSRQFSYTLPVPVSVNPGSYPVTFEVFYQDGSSSSSRVSEIQIVSLTVRDCSPPVQNNQTETVVIDGSQGPIGTDGTQQPTGQVVATARPRTNDALLITGLVVLALLLIAVLVSLILVLRR
jgi:hypothetical protein